MVAATVSDVDSDENSPFPLRRKMYNDLTMIMSITIIKKKYVIKKCKISDGIFIIYKLQRRWN